MRAIHRMAVPFSLLKKRRKIAPKIGKKIKSDRMGMPRIVMKSTPFFRTNDTKDSEYREQRI
jgi:hypothetical protein